MHNNKEVLQYWNDPEVESMYDKYLISAEIDLINSHIKPCRKILDAGCGEGEGTYSYSDKCSVVHAVDFSETRLELASKRLANKSNVILRRVDFLGEYGLDYDYDYIVSQRFLINLMEWDLQKRVILDLSSRLAPGGRLLMLEGSLNGVHELNDLRHHFSLPPIGVKWHNLFFDDVALNEFLVDNGLRVYKTDGLGAYFFLTRGIRPCFDKDLDWHCFFNNRAADVLFPDNTLCSRLKLWVIGK